MTVSLTPRAIEAIEARAAQADVRGWMLRIAVVAGGCNGLTYDLYFVEEPGPEDMVVDSGTVKVVIDRTSAPLLDGTVIDLPKSDSFRFDNPRARKRCSCGASFEV